MTTPSFAQLHVPGRPFLLVNAWDVLSSLTLARAGHPAIGTTSLGITAAAGLPDGSRAGREHTVALVRALTGRLPAHLSVDLEDGYDDDPRAVADLVAALARLGAVGVNLEDGARSARAHAAVIAAVKGNNPDMFVNARTDIFWSGSHDLTEALNRLRAYRDAGADGLFIPGLADRASLEQVVALGAPVNALWNPGSGQANSGIARLSTGSALYRHALASALRAADAAAAGQVPAEPAVSYLETQELLTAANQGPQAAI